MGKGYAGFGLLLLLLVLVLGSGVAQAGDYKEVGRQGLAHMVVVPGANWRNQDVYRIAVADLCGRQSICMVMFWHDATKAARRLPMTDAQVAAKVAQWSYNGNTGHRDWQWSCEISRDAGCTR